jgi:hypothetical protein
MPLGAAMAAPTMTGVSAIATAGQLLLHSHTGLGR